MQIVTTKQFDKAYKKAPFQIQEIFKQRIVLLEKDKFHSTLNNHKLKGKFLGCQSINITGDWRVIFKDLNNGEILFLIIIGTHGQLYK